MNTIQKPVTALSEIIDKFLPTLTVDEHKNKLNNLIEIFYSSDKESSES